MTSRILQELGTLFYIVDPDATTFQDPKQVPDYTYKAVPYFTVILFTEMAVYYLQGKDVRASSALCSASIGLMYLVTQFTLGFMHLAGYEWLYERRLMDIPWDSKYTWIAALIMVDFCYYWIHRANHEVNFLWAVHQVHHSSEDYHLTVGLRLSFLATVVSYGFFQPLALLGFPLSSVLVHNGLNLIFQFWLHTELVKTLGPLEWIFNTPSHHRVHHGANKWCLDKNYGSLLIIWDRLFGTFQVEKKDQDIYYGLTEQPQTFNVLWHQFFYFGNMYHKARSMKTWGDVLKVIFYGPGWNPGTPRLGDPSAWPDIEAPRIKYDYKIHICQVVYLVFHYLIAVCVYYLAYMQIQNLSWISVGTFLTLGVTTAVSITSVCNGWKWASMAETIRCAFFVAYGHINPMTHVPLVNTLITIALTISALIWGSQIKLNKVLKFRVMASSYTKIIKNLYTRSY